MRPMLKRYMSLLRKLTKRKFFVSFFTLCGFLYLLKVSFFTKSDDEVFLDIDDDAANPYYYKFNLVVPSKVPKETNTKNFFLIILVNSATRGSQYRDRRNGIRESWAKKESCENLHTISDPKNEQYDWRLVFMLGKTNTKDGILNVKEAERHNDILIGNIFDNYLNNTLKVYMGFLWVSRTHPNVKYILKTDDDVYVRIPAVIDYLVQKNLPSRFYGGSLYLNSSVYRKAGFKWSVGRKYYDKENWPPFAPGAFILFSNDLMPGLLNHVTIRKPVQTDDTYIAVVMHDLNVTATNIPSFIIETDIFDNIKWYDDCEFLSFNAFAHDILPSAMKRTHNRLESLCKNNKITMSQNCAKKSSIFSLHGIRSLFRNIFNTM